MREIIPKPLISRRSVLLATAVAMGCSSGDGGTEPSAITVVILPVSASIAQGGSSTFDATLTASGNFTGAVNLTVSGGPNGVTGVVSNFQTVGLVTTATVTINVGFATPPGRYALVVRGTGTGVTDATAPFDLTVTDALVVSCPSGGLCQQWAVSATASSEYTAMEWSASQATGLPNSTFCNDDPRAWASLTADGIEWLELAYQESVRPTEIDIYEVLGVSSIVKVEVKDGAGTYRTVYTAQPGTATCPRVLAIPITGISETVKVVRINVDQRTLNNWNEIDAVKLIGSR